MNIAILGYGKEGRAVENYFSAHFPGTTFDIFENLAPAEFTAKDYSAYDLIFRSPSIPPFENAKLTSITKYFFDHCPCKIIGVTATKGKGTTCSLIKALLDAENYDAHLVGNIGVPALGVLGNLNANSVVIYEMSSFQLWDLKKSPNVAVVGMIAPDHLNVHRDFADYVAAKAHIAGFQTAADALIYYKNNQFSQEIANLSRAKTKIPYPFEAPEDILSTLKLPGAHNRANALAAIAAVAAFKNLTPAEYCKNYNKTVKSGLATFTGLPHRLEFLREIGDVKYYDDNFSTTPGSTRVAIDAFPGQNLIVIAGGRDKTAGADLPEIAEILNSKNVKKVILIGESGHALYKNFKNPKFELAETLESAVKTAENAAAPGDIILMSPAAASFDMFDNVYARGDKFQELVSKL